MVADSEQAQGAEPKASIFISYSRKDMAFADRLEAMLRARGFEPLIDRTEIYAFEDWWKRIEALIARADTVVFVLSPDAVTSDIALKEVAHAASLNKRFAPIVCRRVDDSAVPEALRRLNFIFFDDPARVEASADQLGEALQTDIGWIRQHTEFGEAARRWAVAGHPGGLLLRSPALEEAERWISSRPRGAPEPTVETQAFVPESRRGASRRRNILTGSLAVGLFAALALAGLAYWQRGIAVEQRNVAEGRRISTLAELATSKRLRGDWDTALRLGVHAARLALARGQAYAQIAAPWAAVGAAVSLSYWELVLSGHGGYVNSANFSPDGKRIVTASADKSARIWDAATGVQVALMRGHEKEVFSAAFSPDGMRIVTGSADKTARIWDAATGKQIAVLFGHEKEVRSAAFSPDGTRIVTTSSDRTARIWDGTTGQQVAVLLGHTEGVNSAVFSPDGNHIATASFDRTVGIWNAVDGTRLALLSTPDWARSVAFSPDGTRIVAAVDVSGAVIFDVKTEKQGRILKHGFVKSAAYSPDGTRIVTASNDKTARIWDVATGEQIAVLYGHGSAVNSAVYSPDGRRIVTASGDYPDHDNTARVWNAKTQDEIAVLSGHEHAVNSAAFSPDGTRIVTASDDKTARVWDAITAKTITTLQGHDNWVKSAGFSPDGARIVTASRDKTARIWDVASGKQIAVLREPKDDFDSAEFSPDSAHVVTASGLTAHIWDAETAKEIAALKDDQGHVDPTSAAYSPDGSRIVAPGFKYAGIWSTATAKMIAALCCHENSVESAVYSPDGSRIVTASIDHTARIWDATTAKELAVLRGPEAMLDAAFSPDGTRVVIGLRNGIAQIWDVITGTEIAVIRNHDKGWISSANFSPDGKRVVAVDDNNARIWDVHFATMSAPDLVTEVCARRLRGLTKLSRDEMRLAGYSDDTPEIDVCLGVE